jgi:hypothetical protein
MEYFIYRNSLIFCSFSSYISPHRNNRGSITTTFLSSYSFSVDDRIFKTTPFTFASSMTSYLKMEHIMIPRAISLPSTFLFPILTLATTNEIICDDGFEHKWRAKTSSPSWELFHCHLESSLVELVETSFSSSFHVFNFFMVETFIIYFTHEFA